MLPELYMFFAAIETPQHEEYYENCGHEKGSGYKDCFDYLSSVYFGTLFMAKMIHSHKAFTIFTYFLCDYFLLEAEFGNGATLSILCANLP